MREKQETLREGGARLRDKKRYIAKNVLLIFKIIFTIRFELLTCCIRFTTESSTMGNTWVILNDSSTIVVLLHFLEHKADQLLIFFLAYQVLSSQGVVLPPVERVDYSIHSSGS